MKNLTRWNYDGTYKPIPLSAALRSDAYKETHWLQTPDKTEIIYSYLESRGFSNPNVQPVYEYLLSLNIPLPEVEKEIKKYSESMIDIKETIFYGLQIILKKYFVGKVLTKDMIEEADAFCKGVFGQDYFNRDGWIYILNKYDGRLPILIKAVPEGTIVPIHNALMTVENTDEKVPFLTNFCETMLMQNWYPITIASIGYAIKNIISKWAVVSGGTVSPFHLNDFGFRSVSSLESAGIGSSAHLVNFMGTDTLEGVRYADYYYDGGICGHSVAATEHSTTTIYTKKGELEAYRTFIKKFPKSILSVVSDSWNIYEACKMFGTVLKEAILARDGKFVVRPDSGNPITVSVEVLDILWEYFGGTINEKGYKVLNPKIGVIYGDGINMNTIDKILENVVKNGYCVDCIVFGMGGGLLQQINRDTFKFAFKCAAGKINNFWRDVYKQPFTDSGKNSKRGRMKLIKNNGSLITVAKMEYDDDNIMQPVFKNGELLRDFTFNEVRNNVLRGI